MFMVRVACVQPACALHTGAARRLITIDEMQFQRAFVHRRDARTSAMNIYDA
jgi:hypothetical protein